MLHKFKVWNTYLAPIISYVEQCTGITPNDNKRILRALGGFVGGVHGWCSPSAFGFFKLWFCYPIAPRLPYITSTATLARMFVVFQLLDPDLFVRNSTVGPDSTFCCSLDVIKDNCKMLAKIQIEPMNVWSDVVREHGTSKGRKSKGPQKDIQKAFSKLLLAHFALFNFPGSFKTNNPLLPRIVCRKKWEDNLCCIPKQQVGKCLAIATRNICSLSNNRESVPPRVVAAMILAIHHGWPTHHRCGRSHKCYLCGQEEGDKMQHIINCRFVKATFV